MNPFKLMVAGLAQFLRSLPLAALLAVLSLLGQLGLGVVLSQVAGPTGIWPILALFVFAHAWFVHFLAAWPLRRQSGMGLIRTVARAGLWAGVHTAGAAGLVGVWAGLVRVWPQVPDAVSANGAFLAVLAAWAVYAGSGLPSRLMLGRAPSACSGLDRVLAATVAVSPWLLAFTVLSWPARTCEGECWGAFEGGMVMLPILGVLFFLMAAGAAAVSVAVHRTAMDDV